MENRFLPSYTIGPDAYDEIPAVCGKFGKTAVIIGGNQSRAAAEPLIRLAVKGEIEITGSFLYGDDATFENGDKLTEIPEVKAADMIFAVGGAEPQTPRNMRRKSWTSLSSHSQLFLPTAPPLRRCVSCTTRTIPTGPTGTEVDRLSIPSSTPMWYFIHQGNIFGPV